MPPKPQSPDLSVQRRINAILIAITLGIIILIARSSAHAADRTWSATPDTSDWVPGSGKNNWGSPNVFPGSNTATINNPDTATFLTSTITSITLNQTINIKNLTFGVSGSEPSSFTVGTTGGNSLLLTSAGSISIPSGTNVGSGHTETVNAPLVLEPGSGTTLGTYTFSNAAASPNLVLSIGGAISGGTTTQGITLTLTGSNSGANTVSGAITNGTAAGGVSISKTSSGTWTLTGNNGYTGTTSITGGTLIAAGASTNQALGGTTAVTVGTGGTLMLGASNQINNLAGITLNGGTLNLNGFSEGAAGTNGVGALTLSANSTINFGTGNTSVIQFALVGTHTAGTTLSITNWNGVPFTGGSGDRLLFSGLSTTFTSAYNQSDVSFNGITGYAVDQFAGFFEVTAVPEPSTWIGGALALAAIGFTQRRRLRKLIPVRA